MAGPCLAIFGSCCRKWLPMDRLVGLSNKRLVGNKKSPQHPWLFFLRVDNGENDLLLETIQRATPLLEVCRTQCHRLASIRCQFEALAHPSLQKKKRIFSTPFQKVLCAESDATGAAGWTWSNFPTFPNAVFRVGRRVFVLIFTWVIAGRSSSFWCGGRAVSRSAKVTSFSPRFLLSTDGCRLSPTRSRIQITVRRLKNMSPRKTPPPPPPKVFVEHAETLRGLLGHSLGRWNVVLGFYRVLLGFRRSGGASTEFYRVLPSIYGTFGDARRFYWQLFGS